MPYLHITLPDGKDVIYSLENDEITLGRKDENEIVIPEGQVSRVHAKITKKEDGYYVADMGSYNGTKDHARLFRIQEEAKKACGRWTLSEK
jgi:pSer/pThr/pTyr-binding forkhead associated (FHA) protein